MRKKLFAVAFLLFIISIFLLNTLYRRAFGEIYEMRQNRKGNEIIKSLESFEKKRGHRIIVYYKKQDEEYVNLVVRAVNIYYPLIAGEMEYECEEDIRIIIFPSEQILKSALHIDTEKTPMGVYYGGILNILSPSKWVKEKNYKIKDIFLDEGPLVHEIAHLVIDKKAKGNYPLFFTEGVALYYENKYMNYQLQSDISSVATENLMKDFRVMNEETAYAKSFEIISALAKSKGEKSIISMINLLEKGYSFKKAYKTVYGTHIQQER